MSNSNVIKIFYGNGEIIHGPTGVDLSRFPETSVEHPNPEFASIRDLKEWFVAFFQMDPSIYSVTIQCLYLKSVNPVMFELRDDDRTYKWKKWVQWCRRCNAPLTILVQACAKEDVGEASSSQAPESESVCGGDVPLEHLTIGDEGAGGIGVDEVDGAVDGGEDAPEIVQELESVDRNAMQEEENLNLEDEHDDDEDDDEDNAGGNRPIPEEWNRPDASSMEAMDMHDSHYQYGYSMIEVNQLFPNKQELKDTVSRWAVTSLREV
ncbi:unnamed protein product [Urochloa humidicola]